MNQKFFNTFKRDYNNSNKNGKDPNMGILRTPMATQPMNGNPMQHVQFQKEKMKKKSKKKHKKNNGSVKEKFNILTGSNTNSNLFNHILDALISSVLWLILSTKMVSDSLSKLIPGFYCQIDESYQNQNQIVTNNLTPSPHMQVAGNYQQPSNTYIIKSSRTTSWKGKIIKMIIVVLIYALLNNWFLTP